MPRHLEKRLGSGLRAAHHGGRRLRLGARGLAGVCPAHSLPNSGTIRIPTIAGYAALKLVAWLDRSAWGAYKDASDIAAVLHWHSELPEVATRLWDTDHGVDIVVEEESVYPSAAPRILGQDIADVIGSTRLSELAARWPGPRADSLYAEMNVTNTLLWPRAPEERQRRVQAMERGPGIESAT